MGAGNTKIEAFARHSTLVAAEREPHFWLVPFDPIPVRAEVEDKIDKCSLHFFLAYVGFALVSSLRKGQ